MTSLSLDVPVAADTVSVAEVALIVRDLDRIAAFYRDAIGLAVLAREPGRVQLGVDGVVLLELLHRPDAPLAAPGSAGLFHTAFLLPSRGDLGRWMAHCAATGVVLDGAADHLVSEAVYLSDPEGNGIEVYADRPRAQWRWHGEPGARRVEMANHPLDVPGLRRAAGTQPWAGAPRGTRIGHVHLCVGDVPAAVRCLHGVVGLDVTAAWPGAAFLSTGGYHHHVAVNSWRSAGAGPRPPEQAGLAAVTFLAAPAALAGIAERAGLAVAERLQDPWNTQLRFRPAA